MPLPWWSALELDWTQAGPNQVEKALRAVYKERARLLVLADNIGIDRGELEQQAPALLVRELLVKAHVTGRLELLMMEVLTDKTVARAHPLIREAIAGQEALLEARALALKPYLSVLAGLPSSVEGHEALLNPAAGFLDPVLFRTELARAEMRVARVEKMPGTAVGTGWLVGASLLLTNAHVAKTLAAGSVARFDYKVVKSGEEASAGRTVAFASERVVTQGSDIGPGSIDYALLRLAEPVGEQGIGSEKKGDPRGWWALDGAAYAFDPNEPIAVLGYPSGGPLRLSYGNPAQAMREGPSRVRYKTNTETGSSGSPVFNRDFQVVALHSGGASDFNKGIPLDVLAPLLAGKL